MLKTLLQIIAAIAFNLVLAKILAPVFMAMAAKPVPPAPSRSPARQVLVLPQADRRAAKLPTR